MRVEEAREEKMKFEKKLIHSFPFYLSITKPNSIISVVEVKMSSENGKNEEITNDESRQFAETVNSLLYLLVRYSLLTYLYTRDTDGDNDV